MSNVILAGAIGLGDLGKPDYGCFEHPFHMVGFGCLALVAQRMDNDIHLQNIPHYPSLDSNTIWHPLVRQNQFL